jgi:hypothetical protein
MLIQKYKPRRFAKDIPLEIIRRLSMTESYNSAARKLDITRESFSQHVKENYPEIDKKFLENGKLKSRYPNMKSAVEIRQKINMRKAIDLQ